MDGTYGVREFVEDARRIMEVPGGVADREAAVRQLEPLLRRALAGPGWADPEFATTVEGGRRGFDYYRNPDGSLFVYGVRFRQGSPTPVHDHVTWGLIGVHSGEQRTARYRRRDDGSTPGRCSVELVADEVLTHGATYPLLPPHDIHSIEVVAPAEGLSIHVLGADLKLQRRRIFDVAGGTSRRSRASRWHAEPACGNPQRRAGGAAAQPLLLPAAMGLTSSPRPRQA
jgi:predicted metal-dependent enzyme (double-stranded beta helix superfamily)